MNDIESLSNKKLLKLLAIILLSDGTLHNTNNKYYFRLETVIYNKCQHDFFDFLCKRLFNKKPGKWINKKQNPKILSSRIYVKKYTEKMLKLSPSYKTTPGPNMTKEEFLNSDQPSFKFILEDRNIELKKLALRTYFDFDGSIVPSFKIKHKKERKKDRLYEYYQIQFECEINISETNPNLVKEISELCNNLGLRHTIKKDKRKWSELEGIRISEVKSVKRFINFGGPITNVRISLKSHRIMGKTKRAVCFAVDDILKNNKLSYYFKDRKSALEKKSELDKLLISTISKNS